MVILNVASVIVAIVALIIGIIIRRKVKRRMREIEGLGTLHKQKSKDENKIYL